MGVHVIRRTQHMPTLNGNYLTTGDAEGQLGNLSAWGSYSSTPRVQDLTEFHGGLASVRYTCDGNAAQRGCIPFQQRIVDRGTWQVSGWVKCLAGYGLYVSVRLVTTTGGYITGGPGVTPTSTGDWQFLQSAPYVLGRIAVMSAHLLINPPYPPVGTFLYVDDVRIEQIA